MFVYEVEFSYVIRGHPVYKAAWSPIIGESLACRKDDRKVACSRRSDSGARAKKKSNERAGKNEGSLGKRTRERL